jgi:hypothetical protein
MHLISLEVLNDAKGLSIGATAFFLFVGLLLWAFGWRWHKFWLVFAITLSAGVLGISAGRSAGVQVLVVSVLVSIAAGMLALEIAKIMAFVSGGTAAWMSAQAVMPEAHELWAAFLCGGLIGVVLYRLWTMLTTAFVGVLLIGHTTLLLGETFGALKASEFAEKQVMGLNTWAAVASVVGVFVQSWTGRIVDAPADAEADGEAEPTANRFAMPAWVKKATGSFAAK